MCEPIGVNITRTEVDLFISESRKPKIPIILCIDVEPDPFLVNRFNPEPWDGYEATHRYFAKMRARFEAATGAPVRYTWCFRMDPQVAESYGTPTWVADRYPDFIAEYLRNYDELGTHPHAYRWVEERQTWLEDLGNQEWINHCTNMSISAHFKAFGKPCETFRFGNFWLNTATVNLCESLGIRYEMTVEPGLPPNIRGTLKNGLSTGDRPDLCRVPRVPYEPCEEDFCEPVAEGSRSIKIIPITSGSLKLGRKLRARWRRLRRNGFRHRLQNTPLSMWKEWRAPNTFDIMLDRAIVAQRRPYLAFAIRSSIGIGHGFQSVDKCLSVLLEHPERKRFVFSTPAQAMDMLQGHDISL